MSTPYESARLLLKLYDLRREPLLREARTWFTRAFHPDSAREILDLPPEENRMYRMVTSYWDMACSFVNHGAIDRQMFLDVSGEAIGTFAKVHPHLPALRDAFGNPNLLAHLEKVVLSMPGIEPRLEALRERYRDLAARDAAAAKTRGRRPARKGAKRR